MVYVLDLVKAYRMGRASLSVLHYLILKTNAQPVINCLLLNFSGILYINVCMCVFVCICAHARRIHGYLFVLPCEGQRKTSDTVLWALPTICYLKQGRQLLWDSSSSLLGHIVSEVYLFTSPVLGSHSAPQNGLRLCEFWESKWL